MTRFSVSIGSSVTFGVGTRCRRFLRRHVVGVCTRYERDVPALPTTVHPILYYTGVLHPHMVASAQCAHRPRSMVSIVIDCLSSIDVLLAISQLLISIHPIEVVGSTPSQGSTSSVADP